MYPIWKIKVDGPGQYVTNGKENDNICFKICIWIQLYAVHFMRLTEHLFSRTNFSEKTRALNDLIGFMQIYIRNLLLISHQFRFREHSHVSYDRKWEYVREKLKTHECCFTKRKERRIFVVLLEQNIRSTNILRRCINQRL